MKKVVLWAAAAFFSVFTSTASATMYTATCQGQTVSASSLAVFGPNCKNITEVGSSSSGTNVSVVTPGVSVKPSCPAGWTPSGSTCYSPAGLGAGCAPGGVMSGGMCTSKTTTTVTASCPNGMSQNLNDGVCRTYNMKTRTFGLPQAYASCPAGATRQGSSCITTITNSYKPYTICSVGTPEGPYCKTPPSCPAGLRNVGGSCVK